MESTLGSLTTDRFTPALSPAGHAEIGLQQVIERLFSNLRIAVVHGGSSQVEGAVINPTRNPRGEKTYEAVANDIANALREIGFAHVSLLPEDMRLGDRLRQEGINLVWLNTGGTQGYSPTSHAASMLELFGLPYIGHNPLNAGLLDNKHAFKHLLAGLRIDTAPFMTWHRARGPFIPGINSLFHRVFGAYSGPFVVKPISGRASLNILIADRVEDLPATIDAVYAECRNLVQIEQYLSGREYCVAVCGPTIARQRMLTTKGNAFSFSMVERLLDADERIFTSMDVRPITADRFRLLDPNRDAEIIRRLRHISETVYLDCNLETAVRLDIRADHTGRLFVLEANPKPDLKRPGQGKTSIVACGLEVEGMDYPDLILSFLADRLRFLLNHRPETMTPIRALLAPCQ